MVTTKSIRPSKSVEQRGVRVVNAGVSFEDKPRQLFKALSLGIARRRSGDQ
jgi:hypothetical protein